MKLSAFLVFVTAVLAARAQVAEFVNENCFVKMLESQMIH